jgi:ATP-dependent RNA helicase RhlE
MTFDDLGLPEPVLRAVREKGYTEPSPVQAQAIPLVLDGNDLMAAAQTGTGKTAGFTLPILAQFQDGQAAASRRPRALVLTPTRELAAQVNDSVVQYGKFLRLNSTVVFGGVKINPQIEKLKRGVDILIATPGRLLDLHGQGAVHFDDIETLVLDEADRMLDMGFIHDIRRIVKLLPKQRQTLMFSATFSKEIRALAADFLVDPKSVQVTPPNSTAERVDQWIYPVDKKRKPALLINLVQANSWDQVLIFTRTKHGANRLSKQLDKAGISSAAIHGNKSQGARTRALADFKKGGIQALVATDIAARGLDIDQLPQVVNFDLPNVAEDYIHRIGRTGRAGAAGEAHSLVSADEVDCLSGIERLIRQSLPRQEVEGFEPEHQLPERSAPARRPSGSNKPRRARSGSGQRPGGGNGDGRHRSGGRRRQSASGNR